MYLTNLVAMGLKVFFTGCGLALRWAATKTTMDLREKQLAHRKYFLGKSSGPPKMTMAGAIRSYLWSQ